MKGLLEDCTIRLLSCQWLLEAAAEALPQSASGRPKLQRRQEMPEEAFVTGEQAASIFASGERKVLVLSYGWHTGPHPHPPGLTLPKVRPHPRDPPTAPASHPASHAASHPASAVVSGGQAAGPAEDEPEGRERSSGVFGPPGSYGAASSSDRSSLSAVRPLSVRDSCLSRPTASARGGSAVFKEDLWKDACRLAF